MYVEDYLELLAGNAPCEHCNNYWFISLANYDHSPVRSMSTTVQMSRGLSDKQRELALRIILKYKKQFAKHGYDISCIEQDPQWRSPLRQVDRTKKVYIEDGAVCVRFPFHPQMVEFFRKYSRTREFNIEAGHVEWSTEKKVWVLDCTEQNINAVYTITKSEDFSYSKEFKNAVDKINSIKQDNKNYKLICDLQHGSVLLQNACEDLQQRFQSSCTGNILYDIGLAKRYGVNDYSLSVFRYLYKQDPLLIKLVAKRVIYFEKSNSINEITKHLKSLGLHPVGDSPDEKNKVNARSAYFRETMHGIKQKYVEQRVPLVLYCTNYVPFGVEDPYLLKGY